MSALQALTVNAKENWPNDKDLIRTEDFLKVQAFGGFFLLADKEGYLGYVTTQEELMELINEQSKCPGSLRGRTCAPVHTFKSRGFKGAKAKFDVNSIDI